MKTNKQTFVRKGENHLLLTLQGHGHLYGLPAGTSVAEQERLGRSSSGESPPTCRQAPILIS